MNKIIHRFQLRLIYAIVFLLTSFAGRSQDTILNKYGLWVIDNVKMLKKTIAKQPAKQLVELQVTIPALLVDLRYAGENNFIHTKLYPVSAIAYLRKPAADALIKIQQQLKEKNFGLKIFDAYRPYAVTEKMWEPVQDDRYAADPKKGSGHNRAVAVDLTLIDLKTNKELDMGTGFDNFSDTAHHAFTNLPAEVLQNRLLLKTTMEQYGFKALDTEWWHYSLPNAKDFELLNISFKEIKRMNRKKQQ